MYIFMYIHATACSLLFVLILRKALNPKSKKAKIKKLLVLPMVTILGFLAMKHPSLQRFLYAFAVSMQPARSWDGSCECPWLVQHKPLKRFDIWQEQELAEPKRIM